MCCIFGNLKSLCEVMSSIYFNDDPDGEFKEFSEVIPRGVEEVEAEVSHIQS